MVNNIIVVGAGAAGYFASINCAENNPKSRVLLLEGSQKPLVKVAVSGGGRCNVTHHCFDPVELVKKYPRGYRELRGPFTRFQPSDTIEWFRKREVLLKVEEDGRMFPVTDSSQTIIDCLEREAQKNNVQLELVVKIKKIKVTGQGFELSTQTNKVYHSNKLVMATGSSRSGMELVQSLGHRIKTCVPSLFTFKVQDPRLSDLQGVSFKNVRMTLYIKDKKVHEENGPLLITHWGLSGPAVIRLSAWGALALFKSQYQAELKLNFMPQKNDMYQYLRDYKDRFPTRVLKKSICEELPKRYWLRLLEITHVSPMLTWGQLNKDKLNRISKELERASFDIVGKGQFKEEFVTCGGVDLKEVDFKTMESKLCPGLYFAGEILDIDGITGGFNFQNAWTTAWLASQG